MTRVDGFRYPPITSGRRCSDNPLIFRAVFSGGRVAEVYTDGRERQLPVAQVKVEVGSFGKSVVRADEMLRPARYFASEPTQADIADQWE